MFVSAGVPCEEDRGQHHRGDGGHRIGLEQVGRHAGAVADVVADIVGDSRGIARIVFRNAGFDLADEIAADVRTLGEDAAAETGEDRDQRSAKAERDDGVDDKAIVRLIAEAGSENEEVAGHAQQRQPGNQHAGDRARLEREFETAGERLGRGLRDAHVGAHRNVHADEAGRAGENRADGKADPDQPAEREAKNQKMTTPTTPMVVYWRLR